MALTPYVAAPAAPPQASDCRLLASPGLVLGCHTMGLDLVLSRPVVGLGLVLVLGLGLVLQGCVLRLGGHCRATMAPVQPGAAAGVVVLGLVFVASLGLVLPAVLGKYLVFLGEQQLDLHEYVPVQGLVFVLGRHAVSLGLGLVPSLGLGVHAVSLDLDVGRPAALCVSLQGCHKQVPVPGLGLVLGRHAVSLGFVLGCLMAGPGHPDGMWDRPKWGFWNGSWPGTVQELNPWTYLSDVGVCRAYRSTA